MIRAEDLQGFSVEIHQSNTLAKRGREREQDVHCRVEPTTKSLIAISALIELLD
jgi:hypothetical protein